MNRFIHDNILTSHPLPEMYNNVFVPLLPHQNIRGSLLDVTTITSNSTCCLPLPESHIMSLYGLSKVLIILFLLYVVDKHFQMMSCHPSTGRLYSRLFTASSQIINCRIYNLHAVLYLEDEQQVNWKFLYFVFKCINCFSSVDTKTFDQGENDQYMLIFFAKRFVQVEGEQHTV